MKNTYNVLVAQNGWTKKETDFMKAEAAKGGLDIKEINIALSVREVFNCIKQVDEEGYKYNVLIIQQRLSADNSSVDISDLARIKKSVPGIRILLCVSRDMCGSQYLQELFKAGIYTAFYDEDGTMQKIVSLIRVGRSATEAIKYYDIPEDKEELKRQIGYMEPARLNKIKNLIHKADNEDDVRSVLAHINKLIEKKEFLYVIKHLDEEDVAKIFFEKGMGIFFDQRKYKEDLEEQQNSGFFKKLRMKEIDLREYIIEPDELDARIEMAKIRRMKATEKNEKDEQVCQTKEIEETSYPETPVIDESNGPAEVCNTQEPKVQDVVEDKNIPTVDNDTLEAMKKILGENVSPEMLAEMAQAINSIKNNQDLSNNVEEVEVNSPVDVVANEDNSFEIPEKDIVSNPVSEPEKEKSILESDAEPKKIIVEEEKEKLIAVDAGDDDEHISSESAETNTETDSVLIKEKESNVAVVTEEYTEKSAVSEEVVVIEKETEVEEVEQQPSFTITETIEEMENNNLETDNNIFSEMEKDPEQVAVVVEEKEDIAQAIAFTEESNKEEVPIKEKVSLNLTSLHIKSVRKSGSIYHVVAGSKHAGVTFMASVLAHTYKNKFPERKVCVFSYDGSISQYTALAGVEDEVGKNKIDIHGIDYIVSRHSDIMRVKSEYDVVFVEEKNIKHVSKELRKERIFLITQGSEEHMPMLKESCEYITDVGYTDVVVLFSIFKLEQNSERELRKMLGWNCPLVNVGHLKSPVRGLHMLEELLE